MKKLILLFLSLASCSAMCGMGIKTKESKQIATALSYLKQHKFSWQEKTLFSGFLFTGYLYLQTMRYERIINEERMFYHALEKDNAPALETLRTVHNKKLYLVLKDSDIVQRQYRSTWGQLGTIPWALLYVPDMLKRREALLENAQEELQKLQAK